MGQEAAHDVVRVYWRPGCGFCAGLFRALERRELQVERVNIWEDRDAAAFVRRVANGNETVPTVRIGRFALVNPSASDVMRAVADEMPHHLPAGYEHPRPGRVVRAAQRLFGGAVETDR